MLDLYNFRQYVEHPRKHARPIHHQFTNQPNWLYVFVKPYICSMFSSIDPVSNLDTHYFPHVLVTQKEHPSCAAMYPRCATNGRAQEARHNCRAKRARIFSSFAVTQVDRKHAFMHVQSHNELATTIIRVGEMSLYVTQSSMQVKSKKHSWFDFSK